MPPKKLATSECWPYSKRELQERQKEENIHPKCLSPKTERILNSDYGEIVGQNVYYIHTKDKQFRTRISRSLLYYEEQCYIGVLGCSFR